MLTPSLLLLMTSSEKSPWVRRTAISILDGINMQGINICQHNTAYVSVIFKFKHQLEVDAIMLVPDMFLMMCQFVAKILIKSKMPAGFSNMAMIKHKILIIS